ncbi:MAG: HAMP domain-containing histidine kinase, partial [Deltaproteobacteria bacterium]|nr:HAMP domain-containing histidine kinase [Deltaproteobacteria bacterium]
LRKNILIWVIICLIFSTVGAFILASGITKPIRSFEKAATLVAKGVYEPVDIKSGDEFESLSVAFNKMVVEIDTWSKELNSRVEERTRELSEAQEQIVKTQKLAAIGELGAGVAHEINNPLTGVTGSAQLLLNLLDDDEEKRELILAIINNSRRVASIVDEILRFSQGQWGETMIPVTLEKLLERTVLMHIERFKEKKIMLEWKSREPVQVKGIERDLLIICNALLDNALDATHEGGVIIFDVRMIDGGAVMMAIGDNGCGMSNETKIRAVDPFYRKGKIGSGSKGIGLTTVQKIVDEHEATLTIISKEGEGTTVKIFFPGMVELSKV